QPRERNPHDARREPGARGRRGRVDLHRRRAFRGRAPGALLGHLARTREPVPEHGRRPCLGHRGARARDPARRHLRRLPARARGVRPQCPRGGRRRACGDEPGGGRPRRHAALLLAVGPGASGHARPGHLRGGALRRRVGGGGLLLQLRPQPRVPPADGGVGHARQRRRRGGRAADRRARRPSLPPRDALLLPNAVTGGRAAPARGGLRRRRPSVQRRDVDLALPRAVELAEEDALIGPEGELALGQRDHDLRPDEGRARMGRRIRAVGVVVPPPPVLSDDSTEGALEILDEVGVDVLVDRHGSGRVRDVDERRGARPVAPHRRAHLLSDVDELGLPLRLHVDLVHGRYPTALMATAPVAELEAYRDEADRFIAALDEEYYLHFAGLKDEFELSPIYERFSDLTTLDACRRLSASAEIEGRGARELWRFGCEGYLGDLTRADAEEIAGLEASLSATVDGEEIGYRLLRPSIANEPDRGRRERLDRARVTLTEENLNERYVRIAETRRAATKELGASTYRDLYDGFGFPLEELKAQCERFLTDTEDLYVRALDTLFRRRVGISLEEAKRWDVPRLFRANEWDT